MILRVIGHLTESFMKLFMQIVPNQTKNPMKNFTVEIQTAREILKK